MNIGDHELHGFSFSWFLFVLWVRFSSSFSFFSPFWAVFVVFFAQEHGPSPGPGFTNIKLAFLMFGVFFKFGM